MRPLDEYRRLTWRTNGASTVADEVAERLAAENTTPAAALREQLRRVMAGCPACSPEDADDVEDRFLVGWLLSHGANPDGTSDAEPDPRYRAGVDLDAVRREAATVHDRRRAARPGKVHRASLSEGPHVRVEPGARGAPISDDDLRFWKMAPQDTAALGALVVDLADELSRARRWIAVLEGDEESEASSAVHHRPSMR